MSETDAWAAGLFEGEGCIHPRKDGRNVVLSLKMTDEDVVRRFALWAGCGTQITARPPATPKGTSRKATWRWQTGRREDVIRLLNLMMPYLGVRRSARAEDALRCYL